jgi:hypothetical protein
VLSLPSVFCFDVLLSVMRMMAYVHVAHVSVIHAAVVHTAVTHVSVIHV